MYSMEEAKAQAKRGAPSSDVGARAWRPQARIVQHAHMHTHTHTSQLAAPTDTGSAGRELVTPTPLLGDCICDLGELCTELCTVAAVAWSFLCVTPVCAL